VTKPPAPEPESAVFADVLARQVQRLVESGMTEPDAQALVDSCLAGPVGEPDISERAMPGGVIEALQRGDRAGAIRLYAELENVDPQFATEAIEAMEEMTSEPAPLRAAAVPIGASTLAPGQVASGAGGWLAVLAVSAAALAGWWWLAA
jgi:hypothetical protein